MSVLAGTDSTDVATMAARLNARLGARPATEILTAAITQIHPGRIALVSSFGADSAVLLHLVASVDPRTPVIFIDTGKQFAETLDYRDALCRRLGLGDVRAVGPDAAALAVEDADGTLWRRDPDRCCALRKVAPLEQALAGFDAWIGGRKRFQGPSRASVPAFEADPDGRLLVNPLAAWSAADIAAYFDAHRLPRHPLAARGYASIGCAPCTDRVAPGESVRAGRWRGSDKTECGIFSRPKDFKPGTDSV